MQLAQFNIARMRFPLDDPRMHGFTSRLDELNDLADRSPGFVWRLEDDEGTATSFRPYDDLTLINLSVWETVEDLKAYTYRTAHREPFGDRRSWFEPMGSAHLVLWWVEDGHRPSVAEGMTRLRRLADDGPSELAFTFAPLRRRRSGVERVPEA